MTSAYEVSKWFLAKKPMTHKKIQKLCYYAQAWYCALFDEGPLFAEGIEAWVHGPVIPALYPQYADYRWNEIPQYEGKLYPFSEHQQKVLEAVFETYGNFSGDQLERLTHSESPWKDARGDLKPWENCNEVISIDAMRKYYAAKYREAQND
jgi:uncharacterized phage-associated protein